MSRKVGQIIAVRENTWMVRIPMGCDPQTRQRNYYNRTVHGSLRQAQKFLGKKINELGAHIERGRCKDSLGSIPRSMVKDSEVADLQQDVRKLRESARKIHPPIAG